MWLHSAWFSRGSLLCLASVIEMRGCSRSSSTAAPRLVFDSMAPRHFTRVEFFVLLCLQHLSYLSFAHFAIIYRSIQGATFPSCPNLHIIETSKYMKYVTYSFSSKAAFRLLDNFSDVLRFPTQSANEPRKNIPTHGSFFQTRPRSRRLDGHDMGVGDSFGKELTYTCLECRRGLGKAYKSLYRKNL